MACFSPGEKTNDYTDTNTVSIQTTRILSAAHRPKIIRPLSGFGLSFMSAKREQIYIVRNALG